MSPAAAVEWSLAAVALAAPLSIAGLNAALGLLTLSLMIAWRRDAALRESLAAVLRMPVFRLLAASVAWALLSGLAGLDPERSLRAWPKELHKLWAFAALAGALGCAGRGRALKALGAGLTAAALAGVTQTSTLSGGGAGFVRARGLIHPVSYGEIIGLGLLGAASWLLIAEPKGRGRTAAVAAGIALSVALAMNQTRAVLLALVAVLLVLSVEAPRLRRILLPCFLGLVALAGVWEVLPTRGRSVRNLVAGGPQSSPHRARLVLWRAAWGMARERPLSGIGPSGFRRAFEARVPAGTLDSEQVWGNAHNLYLHQLAERGIPGLALVLALFAAFYLAARRAWRERRDAAALWSLAAVAAFAVMNVTETAWQTEQVATFFLLAWLWGAGPRASVPERL